MNTADAIRRAAPILADSGAGDQSFLKIFLIRAGLSNDQIHDVVRFVPLAFGREILNGMGVTLPDTYVRAMPDGAQVEKRLDAEPFFSAAMALAPALGAELGGEVFTSIAVLSSELQAVNSALNAGADPANLVGGPPLIEWERGEESGGKPWWKFWA